MASARDTLIQHNGFGGQAIYEEPGPVCSKRRSRVHEPRARSLAPRVHAEVLTYRSGLPPGKPERIVRIDDWVGVFPPLCLFFLLSQLAGV